VLILVAQERENYTARNFIISILHQNGMGEESSNYGGEVRLSEGFGGGT